MSQIDFEWEVEAETIDHSDSAGKRGQAMRRLRRGLLLFALLVVAVALAGMALHLRLVQVQTEIAQQLTGAIKAEVAALRIGDRAAYLRMQSGDENWLARQSAQFDRYENLKTAGAIDLTGDILTLRIEGELARARVREDRHGLPYAWLWFYQRAEGGWRHVAQDFEFWGEAQATESKRLVINYRDADERFAAQLAEEASAWLDETCADATCPDAALVIDVSPEMESAVAWRDADGGRLALRSPYVDIARADKPFDAVLANSVFALLSENWLEGA